MDEAKRINFWQILGIALILIGAAYMIYNRTGNRPADPVEPVAPPSQVLPQTGERVPSH